MFYNLPKNNFFPVYNARLQSNIVQYLSKTKQEIKINFFFNL